MPPRRDTLRITRAPGCRCERPLITVDADGDDTCLHCGHALRDLGEMHHAEDRADPNDWGHAASAPV